MPAETRAGLRFIGEEGAWSAIGHELQAAGSSRSFTALRLCPASMPTACLPRMQTFSIESDPDGAMTCRHRGSADVGFHVYQLRPPCGIYVSNADVALAWEYMAMSGDPM